MSISECNDANIPVNCFLIPPKDNISHPGKWLWTAANFMPRKCHVSDDMYEVIGDSKEEVMLEVNKYVIPLYEIALRNIKNGTLYYWKEESNSLDRSRAT
jgi:hypothetical protein